MTENKGNTTRDMLMHMFNGGEHFGYFVKKLHIFSQCLETCFYDTYNKDLSQKIHSPFHLLSFNKRLWTDCLDIFEKTTLYESNKQ